MAETPEQTARRKIDGKLVVRNGVCPLFFSAVNFLIAVGTGYGTQLAVSIDSRGLFDERERLRLDRLRS